MRHARLSTVALLVAPAIVACSGGSDAAHHARQSSGGAAMPPMVRGTVASISPGDLVVQTSTGSVDVRVQQPLHVYQRAPATLADVKDGVFIGVTTVKQPDGTEQATEIHIFPEALRGLGEGSRMMTQGGGGGGGGGSRMTNGAVSGSRMTNGAVSGARMTNGAVSGSRMSNGSVVGRTGSTLVVQYAGGSLEVAVPADVKVTQLKEASKPLAPGDQVVVPATRAADGSLSTDKALLAGR